MSSRSSSARGFTLLELIVAAGILALIAVFSWRALDALVREREAIAASQATIDVYQRAFARLERDALLAGDVELDSDGTVRLVAGGGALDAGSDDSASPTVEYRFRNGALTRTVPGVDRAPLVVVDGVASVAVEAWTPAARGAGVWVRTKAPAPASAPPVAAATPNQRQSALPGTALPVVQLQGGVAPLPAPDTPRPAPGYATGLRITLTTTGGTQLTRTFMVGGA